MGLESKRNMNDMKVNNTSLAILLYIHLYRDWPESWSLKCKLKNEKSRHSNTYNWISSLSNVNITNGLHNRGRRRSRTRRKLNVYTFCFLNETQRLIGMKYRNGFIFNFFTGIKYEMDIRLK